MIEGKMRIKVYKWNCTCGKELYFEDSDFETRTEVIGPNVLELERVKTPCPVCGRLWDNLSKGSCHMMFVTPA